MPSLEAVHSIYVKYADSKTKAFFLTTQECFPSIYQTIMN